MARPDNFLSNFEPLTADAARAVVGQVTEFDKFTAPMQQLPAVGGGEGGRVRRLRRRTRGWWTASRARTPATCRSAPTCSTPLPKYVAEMRHAARARRPGRQAAARRSTRCWSAAGTTPPTPRRASAGLAVYNPIHYQELPELFMDFVCSLTGKSPSTTGAGSEGR